MWRARLLSALTLGFAGCVVHANGSDECGSSELFDCYLEYTPGYGYERVCELTFEPAICIDVDADDDDGVEGRSGSPRYRRPPAASAPAAPPPSDDSAADAGLDLACARDSQCGTGLCIEGECFYGCQADSDCGTADRCLAVAGTYVCSAEENPSVSCTRNAECGFEQVCLNAACHDSCSVTSDCTNELDRCVTGVCVPDRSVVSECLLDRECAAGEVCIDAACQTL